ncbi:MAG: hypothetical protein FGM35_04535 [Rhodocyclaceae bacterium]|nr:hypothetical protein [Rhodocyclaceae bacterium]
MKLDPALHLRLKFLCRVVQREAHYLQETDTRLFAEDLTAESLKRIASDPILAERLDAFVSRFGRLQDTLADKLLPALLDAMAEHKGAAIENLDRAEKLGWLDSADVWFEIRKLRNQMVHEYIEDLVILANALTAGHDYVPTLVETAARLTERVQQRIS